MKKKTNNKGSLTELSDLNIKIKLGDRMIKQQWKAAVAKYHDLPASRRLIICLGVNSRWRILQLKNHDIIVEYCEDLLVTDDET